MRKENSEPMNFPPLVPLLVLILAGCSKPPPPTAPPVARNPLTNSPPKPEGTSVPEEPAAKVSYAGTWAVADDQGRPFDIAVFPNGQAASNWTKGPAAAKGERGFWRLANNRLLVFFQDGWTDVISESGKGFQHRRFEPGTAIDGPPKSESAARRLEGEGFTGVWCLNKEPDGSFLYVALQSSGRAVSTIGGGTEGTWEATKEGALCKWPDGWSDLISASPNGFQKRSWVGPAGQTSTPPDITPALRVGPDGFSVTP